MYSPRKRYLIFFCPILLLSSIIITLSATSWPVSSLHCPQGHYLNFHFLGMSHSASPTAIFFSELSLSPWGTRMESVSLWSCWGKTGFTWILVNCSYTFANIFICLLLFFCTQSFLKTLTYSSVVYCLYHFKWNIINSPSFNWIIIKIFIK